MYLVAMLMALSPLVWDLQVRDCPNSTTCIAMTESSCAIRVYVREEGGNPGMLASTGTSVRLLSRQDSTRHTIRRMRPSSNDLIPSLPFDRPHPSLMSRIEGSGLQAKAVWLGM